MGTKKPAQPKSKTKETVGTASKIDLTKQENSIVRDQPMSLGEHLEELRKRIVRGLLIILAFVVFFMIFGSEIHTIISRPYKNVLGQNAMFYQIKLMAPFMVYLKTSFFLSILFSLPFLLYLVWSFVSPAVDPKTEKLGKLLILFSSILFWAGVALCWLSVFENLLSFFLVHFRPPDIDTKLPIDEYYDLFFTIHVIFGLAFQLPVVLIILSIIGILKSEFLISKWRESVLILAVVGAFLSPGPDVISMMMLFIPLVILFFISLFLMKLIEKSHAEKDSTA